MGKLVRDKIPDIIRESGRTPVVTILDPPDYQAALLDKLDEETHELRQAQTRDAFIDEAADVLEVLSALVASRGMTFDIITEAARRKHAGRGGFAQRIWLEDAD